jgi:hypothetical protein
MLPAVSGMTPMLKRLVAGTVKLFTTGDEERKNDELETAERDLFQERGRPRFRGGSVGGIGLADVAGTAAQSEREM